MTLKHTLIDLYKRISVCVITVGTELLWIMGLLLVIFLAFRQSELVSNSREELYMNLMFKNSSQSHSFQSQAFIHPRLPESEGVCQFMPCSFTASLPPITETQSLEA